MNDPSQMMNRSFGMWPPPVSDDPMAFSKPRRPPPPFAGSNAPGRKKWKAIKAATSDKRKNSSAAVYASSGGGSGSGAGGGYKPPALMELQFQNRLKARRFYPKKKFGHRFAPYAPRNTTSFIMRAKNSGGIASLVSPCPVTPAILPTPKFSPSREDLVDMAKEEWGVDGYGTMKGLIHLRSPNDREEEDEEDDQEEESSDSDVEDHLEVERRLDHDVSRFEMVYPGDEHMPATVPVCLLVNRVDDQDSHLAQLEEENLTLKERFFLMEQEMRDLQRRLLSLEEKSNIDDSSNSNKKNDNNNNKDNNNNSNIIEIAGEEESENESSGDVSSDKSTGDCSEGVSTPMRE